MAKVKKALADGKLSRAEARDLRPAQLERAQQRVAASPDTLRIGTGAQNYISNQMPKASSGGGGANTGGGAGRGVNTAGGGSKQQTPAVSNSWMSTPESKYIRSADMYGMGGADQGVFSGASWNQMSADGYTDDQIRDYLRGQEGSGLMIGGRVKDVLDNYDTYKMPTVPNMPGMTDPRSGDEIGPSTASARQIFFSPVNTTGLTNMFGNAIDGNSFDYSVVGDGKDWNSPDNAAEFATYNTPAARNRMLNSAYAMSQSNPNVSNNQAAFVDSGSAESLLSGSTPGQLDMYGAITPWSQAYQNQLGYQGNWQMPKATAGRKR